MEYYLLSFVIILALGILTPLMPLLFLCGRVVTKNTAIAMLRNKDMFVTYNSSVGHLHRVWISEGMPIMFFWEIFRVGRVIWMPFATEESTRKRFGDRVFVVRVGDRWDLTDSNGVTLFEHFRALQQSDAADKRE